MSKQQRFQFPAQFEAARSWPKVLAEVREVVSTLGRGEVLEAFDCSPSYLDNALVDRDRHRLKAEELVYFLLADRTGRLLRLLAEIAGFEVAEQKPMSPEEKLRALEKVIGESLGPEIRESIFRKAYEGRR